MVDFERDIELLEEYKQWQVINKHKPDTSPTVFMVEKAQQEAYEKLEKLQVWFDFNVARLPQSAVDSFTAIMAGTE